MAKDLDRAEEATCIPVNKQHTKHTLSSSLKRPPVLPKEKKEPHKISEPKENQNRNNDKQSTLRCYTPEENQRRQKGCKIDN
jgi:hypothetical protein